MTTGTNNTAFAPALWLRNGHAQTLWRKLAGASPVNHHRERVLLSDGDFIDLDWAETADAQNNATLVLIVHGLCGCSSSSYVLALQNELLTNNFPSVAMNLRSCSGEVKTKARTYHSGVSDDLAQVLSHLKRQHADKRIAIVGYSLGANILLKWLGESGAGSSDDIACAIAVSTPFTLALCSKAMLSGPSRIYGRYFTRRLLEAFHQKKAAFLANGNEAEYEQLARLEGIDSISNIWEFDDRITAVLHGFEDAADYYRQCSSINFVPDIQARTLLVQSTDDPMIPPEALPQAGQIPDCVALELSSRGGHVGFVAGLRSNWLEKRIVRFISS